jgi:gamma-glutamyltranspeptidase
MNPIPAAGILAAITPGVFDGLMLALETNGMTFAQVVAPALEYADAFPIGDGSPISFIRQRLLCCGPPRAVLPSQRAATGAGTIFKQPAIARTLRDSRGEKGAQQPRQKICGSRLLLKALARRIDFSEKNGGLIRYDDVVASRLVRRAGHGRYRLHPVSRLLDARPRHDSGAAVLENSAARHGPQLRAVSAPLSRR